MTNDLVEKFHIPTIAIHGVGLIGGSLALGLRKAGSVGHVIGVGRSQLNLDMAVELGVIDEIADSLQVAAEAADVIVLATPVGTMEEGLKQVRPVLDQHKIVTDVGSVKQGVVAQAKNCLGVSLNRFVPAHPVAGKEHSGVTAASADLFEQHKVAVTPLPETDLVALKTVESMWRSVGADVVTMEVEEHDRVLAITSHLPHVLAYAMVHYFAASSDRDKCYEMAAGGFYDFTRIASSDPEMWRDICKMNRQLLLDNINGYKQKLAHITDLLESGKDDELEALFSSARNSREDVTQRRKSGYSV